MAFGSVSHIAGFPLRGMPWFHQMVRQHSDLELAEFNWEVPLLLRSDFDPVPAR